jgi:hypothetical protein
MKVDKPQILEQIMCAEKNNDKNGKSTASGCCDGMAEMMKNWCPDGVGDSDCFAKMKRDEGPGAAAGKENLKEIINLCIKKI